MPPLLRRTIAVPFSTVRVPASSAAAGFDTRTNDSFISVVNVTMIGSCARRAPHARGLSGNDRAGLVGCESPPALLDRTPDGTFKTRHIAVERAGR